MSGTPTIGARLPGRALDLGLALVGLVLVAAGWVLPLWTATLHAPQYPGGLSMQAYGHQVTGDVAEISALNHYVGMRAFDVADFPEMRLWPAALVLAAVAVVCAVLVRRPWARASSLVVLWGTPLGVLAVIQLRLHQYGQDLDPRAALRMDPFTPLVVGPTKVWNFVTWSWPGPGLLAIALAALLVTVGPRLLRRCAMRATVGISVALLLTLQVVPAVAATPHDHAGHGTHDLLDLDAILADATPGQRIVLPPGRYRGDVAIDVPVTLEGRGMSTIVGDGSGTVVTVRAAGTALRGLTVEGSGVGPTGDPAAIRIEADDVQVEGVRIEDSYVGIAVESAGGIRIVGNTIVGRARGTVLDDGHAADPGSVATGHAGEPGSSEPTQHLHRADPVQAGARSTPGDGIWLHDVDHVLVRGNLIRSSRDGIYVSFGSDAVIDGNEVRDSRYAVHSMFAESLTLVENHFRDNLSGAVLMYRGPALLLRNHIERSSSPSTGFAVLLKDVVTAEVIENRLVDNRVGLHLDGPAGVAEPTLLAANTIARNSIGVAAYSSARGVFRANSFVDNTVQVLPQGGRVDALVWSDRGWGNLWSSYRGYEGRAAGRGAVPHVEGGALDRLLGRNPQLLAIADSPALRLLRTVEERWSQQQPVLVDELPIVAPLSPALPAVEASTPARVVGGALGTVLLLPFAWLVLRRPGPRPRRRTARRSLDAFPV